VDNCGDPRHAQTVGNWRRMWAGLALASLGVGLIGAGTIARAGSVAAANVSVAPGAELIGTTPSAWTLTDWIGSPPLSLAGLRGKVVLLRWFTDTDCPYCSLTAPALNQLYEDYAARGLVVIGVYHHKQPQPLDVAAVRGWARDYGFQFPVAIDRDWRTLHRWWLDGQRRDFTSVSFLVDQHGVIRHVHPGGALALGSRELAALRAQIDALLPR
jgi:peroxiredoxin